MMNRELMRKKSFMLHYNFPPFSVGEVKFLRSAGRREIGHGMLAERAIKSVLPTKEEFPYTIRIVSDILESNGSSSMATVCGGILALMDAGVPIKSPVAGIKISDVTQEIMKTALNQAHQGRMHILDKMAGILTAPRDDLSAHAPRIFTMKIKTDKIRDVIGPGGKVIRGIVEETGVKIDIDDSGTISIASVDEDSAQKAISIVEGIIAEAELGKIYHGKVKRIMDFGAFVEILPGTEGLVHISQIADERIAKVTDVLQEGDAVDVKVIEIDKTGRIRLSRKDAMKEQGTS